MALDDKFNPFANGMSLNMQDQIFHIKVLVKMKKTVTSTDLC